MFEQFKNKYLGKTVDVDGMYGGQCVDLFNAWNRDYNGTYINCSPSGYARSLAENKKNNGILKYFKETAVNNMIEGTVVVYGNCSFAPVSHVCFFIKDNGNGTYQALQQNTNNRQYVTIDNNPYNGIIGAFIPNQILEEKNKEKKCGKPVSRNEYVDQVKIFDNVTSLRARKAPNGEVLGYMNSGIYNLLERKAESDYEWLKVEENVWFANSGDWCEVLPKKEKPTEPPTEPLPTLEELSQKLHIELVEKEKELKIKDEEITILKENIDKLKDQNKLFTTENEQLLTENVELKKKNKEMEEHIKGEPTLIFTATRTDYYAIKLEENQQLYLK